MKFYSRADGWDLINDQNIIEVYETSSEEGAIDRLFKHQLHLDLRLAYLWKFAIEYFSFAAAVQ